MVQFRIILSDYIEIKYLNYKLKKKMGFKYVDWIIFYKKEVSIAQEHKIIFCNNFSQKALRVIFF